MEPGSFRTGIEQRTRFSGTPIDACEATSGALRAIVDKLGPELFPGDPVRAAAAIYEVVESDRRRHWVILGGDAQRRIGVKLDIQVEPPRGSAALDACRGDAYTTRGRP